MENIYLDLREFNKWIQERHPHKDLISLEELMIDYEDMIDEIDDLKEKIKDLKQDIEDNYRPIPVNEQYEIYDRDFI